MQCNHCVEVLGFTKSPSSKLAILLDTSFISAYVLLVIKPYLKICFNALLCLSFNSTPIIIPLSDIPANIKPLFALENTETA